MAQITIYVPDDVAQRLKRKARQSRKSLSAYLTEIAVGKREQRSWPKWFLDLQGSCRGTLLAPEDLPPENLEPL